MNGDLLKERLEEHAKWQCGQGGQRANLEDAHLEDAHLQGAHLERANLEGAHLERAHLEDAHLERAHLERANLEDAHLEDAHLQRAHLEGAHLEDAHLERAHLEDAHLERAYLERANLEGANLLNTCLAANVAPFDWLTDHGCELRPVGNRILVLGSRTREQIHVGTGTYIKGHLYHAPVFSRDPCTSCHPGLYVAGGPDCDIEGPNRLLVAFWMDEVIIVNKCRVPRFRTLYSKEEFPTLTAKDMDEGPC